MGFFKRIFNQKKTNNVAKINNFLNINEENEFHIGQKITFAKNGKKYFGKIEDFITKEEIKQYDISYCILRVKLENGEILEITDYDLI